MLTYYHPILIDGLIYSLDNLRFQFHFYDEDNAQRFVNGLKKYELMTYYPSYKDYQYRHLFNFGVKGFSFSVGVSLNDNSKKGFMTGYLDVNPNKLLADTLYVSGVLQSLRESGVLDDGFVSCNNSPFDSKKELVDYLQDVFYEVCLSLGNACDDIYLRRYDLAVDVPYSRADVQLLKDRRKYSQFYKSELDFTEYLGIGSNQGRVKVYNKQLEAGLDVPLTRIELTMEDKTYESLLKQWPQVYLRNTYDLRDERLVVQLLQAMPTSDMDFYLRRVSNRQTKNKYKALLLSHPFEPSESAWQQVKLQLDDCMNFFIRDTADD